MPKIAINDANIYYEIQGKGEPLVLITGYTCDHTVWETNVRLLSEEFTVVTFDNRGVGQTTDSMISLNAEILADDAVALTEALGLSNPHFVGHSMGGTVVQTIAAKYPDEIGKIALFNTSTKWRQSTLLALKSLIDMRQNTVDVNITFQSILAWVYGSGFLSQPQKIKEWKEKALQNPFPQSLKNQKRQYEILIKFDGNEIAKKIHAPTLIGYGKEDLLALSYEAKYLSSLILESTLIELDCGHASMQEQPELFCKSLIQFIKN